MKVITVFVIQFMVFVTDAQWNNMCVGRMDGIVFPDMENCDAFLQCQRGAVINQQCPLGTSFDLQLYYCVPSQTIDCGQRRQRNPPVIPPHVIDSPPTSDEHHSVCRNVQNGALLANPENCRAYIECQLNLRLDRECQSGELFEARSGACLSDFAVDCGNRKIPSSSDATIRNVCGNQRDGIRVADHRDCRRYFVCYSQQGTEEICREGELFELNLRRCVNRGVVQCNGRPIGGTQRPVSNGVISSTFCNGMPSGTRISNPEDCQKYYECRNNQRIEMRCGLNQSFDISTNQCRPSSVANCNSGVINRNPQTNAPCFSQPNGRRLPNQNNCRAFIECQSNAQIDKSCENGRLFDIQVGSCLPSSNVRCGTRRIPPTDGELQSPEDFFQPCPRNGVVFRSHPHDCSQYFVCVEGNMIQHSCAAGIYFNPDTLQCDFPENVQCRLTRIVVPQTPLLPDCSSETKYFPNLANCKQYYLCVNNLPQLMDCPSGYLWNNIQMRCDKSDSEICARRFDEVRMSYVYSKPSTQEKSG